MENKKTISGLFQNKLNELNVSWDLLGTLNRILSRSKQKIFQSSSVNPLFFSKVIIILRKAKVLRRLLTT